MCVCVCVCGNSMAMLQRHNLIHNNIVRIGELIGTEPGQVSDQIPVFTILSKTLGHKNNGIFTLLSSLTINH